MQTIFTIPYPNVYDAKEGVKNILDKTKISCVQSNSEQNIVYMVNDYHVYTHLHPTAFSAMSTAWNSYNASAGYGTLTSESSKSFHDLDPVLKPEHSVPKASNFNSKSNAPFDHWSQQQENSCRKTLCEMLWPDMARPMFYKSAAFLGNLLSPTSGISRQATLAPVSTP